MKQSLRLIQIRLMLRLALLAASLGFGFAATMPGAPLTLFAYAAIAMFAFLFLRFPFIDPVSSGPADGSVVLGTSLPETLATLAGDIKTVYGTQLVQVLPDAAMLQKKFPLSDSADYPLVGDYFSALIGLQFPWGFSFLGQGSEGTATNTTLGESLAGQTQPAKIYPCTTVLTDDLAYQILDRANTSNSKQAVLSALSYTGKQMAIIMRNVLELQILHGRQGLGASAGAISTLTVTLDPATTSPGILSLLIGARLQWMQGNLTSARTANSTANYLTVSAVNLADPAAPTITMVATGTTNVAAITTGDVMYIAGARGVSVASSDTSVPQYEQIGLGLQLAETSASVFGITKSSYIGWVANQMTSIGAFSPSVLMTAAQKSMSRGGELGEYLAILSPAQWAVLNSALATNEQYNQQSPSFAMQKKTGTDEIIVKHGGITIECMSHPLQKDGQFYLVPVSEVKRIGSVDLTFAVPGEGGDEYYYPLPGYAKMQRQCRADWQLVLLKPPSGTIGTGITYG